MTKEDDEGFGLVEVIVAMFLLAVLAIAFLPILINGLKTSQRTATTATATQIMDAQFDAAQSVTACGSIATSTLSPTDSRGTALTVTRTRGACPTTYPGTVSYTVSVSITATASVVASGTTLIYVSGG